MAPEKGVTELIRRLTRQEGKRPISVFFDIGQIAKQLHNSNVVMIAMPKLRRFKLLASVLRIGQQHVIKPRNFSQRTRDDVYDGRLEGILNKDIIRTQATILHFGVQQTNPKTLPSRCLLGSSSFDVA